MNRFGVRVSLACLKNLKAAQRIGFQDRHVGVGRSGLLEKGPFQKGPFSRESRKLGKSK